MYLTYSAICVVISVLVFAVLEIARHFQYLRHRDSGFVPGTQHWCIYALIVAVPFELAAIVFMILWAAIK
jgi:hypothetical protein